MIQEQIYKKDINRIIDGVIKADSTAKLAEEITEFVITGEQIRLLPRLFDTLVPPQQANCVWISGDFGSGKSHLLKILSYVLENKLVIEGRPCAEIFAEKANDDFELKGQIQKACKVPTESVLFNIQELHDGLGKNVNDPVLAIFLKVFNKKFGYDEKKPEIAEIERYYDNKGQYELLKSEYQKRHGESWEDARKSILLKLQKLAEVVADIEGIDKATAEKNLRAQINGFKMDIDGFVTIIKEHLAKQPAGSRFIFFVDEVGQFIGKDVHRMLSLQTIAEGLTDKTDGRSFIVVTSQMDMESTLGDLNTQQSNDFSRIQGRFTTRIFLTSANADEVIQRRLLEKKEDANKQLCLEYDKQKNIIRSLFNFGDQSQFRNNYKSDEQYAICFPFVDYQFNLLQASIIELSKNNAFSGKQQSVGERSMLTITQDVAKLYKDKDLNQIVQFCDMYEGLRGVLQTKISNDILQAERTLNDELALKVLKTLFLVKYVKGFPSSLDNITRVMLPTLDTDFPAFRSEIQEALNKLVRQSYIEKGANDEYHYQTNEEKDIETEIKNEELRPEATNEELKKIFRDEIFSESKIKLSNFKIFPYGRMVDEVQDGRDAEMFIHFITPLNNLSEADRNNMNMYSMRHPEQLIVVLGEDKYLSDDMVMFKKADKCLTRLLSRNDDGYRQQIISDKRRVNSRRREAIVDRLIQLTKSARLYIGGNELTDIKSQDIKNRLNDAMKSLVEQVYTNLKMLTIEYDDAMLKSIINSTTSGTLFGNLAEDACSMEIFNEISKQQRMAVRTKVKDLVDYFKGNTYGWYETAILCIIAKLYKLDKISFRNNGQPVADRDLYNTLTNSMQQANTIVDIEEAITPAQVTKLKGQYKEFFNDESCTAQSAKDVHSAFIERLKRDIEELRSIYDRNRFEFVKPLDAVLVTLKSLSNMVYPGLYQNSKKVEDALDDKLDIADEIRNFITGPQFSIFKRVETLTTGNQANLAYVSQEQRDVLTSIYNSTTPWRQMTKANDVLNTINEEIKELQSAARNEAVALINEKFAAIKAIPAYTQIPENLRSQIDKFFSILSDNAKEERFIGNLKAMKSDIDHAYENSLKSINKWVEDEANKPVTPPAGGGNTPPVQPATPVKTFVRKESAMNIPFDKPMLETEEDVNAYLEALRTKMMSYINQNKNIMLN
ncbi:BREX system P-loop protein BrxC [Segatella copri]|uniref:BREX system P-loop protein BrxC n=1 Tax=Segatella copri TaxID=165179 RepID=UPI003F9E5FC0